MINSLLFLSITFCVALGFGTFAFELGALCILVVPIESYLIGLFTTQSTLLAYSLLAINFSVVFLVKEKSSNFKLDQDSTICFGLWILSFVLIHTLCMMWPDFMSMGERLRDYALLSEVIKYPSNPQEPWMAGYAMTYYIYWYRFGAFIHQVTLLPTWEIYHSLQSITFGLYIAVLYRLLSTVGCVSRIFSVVFALIIAFGSNVQGLLYAINHEGQTWWAPSRVVKGAINEFPVWSFLLGDLHPHYLNLSLIGLFIVIGWHCNKYIKNSNFIYWFLFLVPVSFLWLYNANAWEVPMFALFLGTFFAFHKEFNLKNTLLFIRNSIKIDLRLYSIGVLLFILILSLIISASHISGGGDPFRFVKPPIVTTSTNEMFLHWGFQLIPIILAFFLRLKKFEDQIIFVLAIIASILSSVALSLIITLLIYQGYQLLSEESDDQSKYFFNSFGMATLILLFLPEVFYLDDPYGGENERMNTIFKSYTVLWGMLGVFSTGLCINEFPKLIKDIELANILKWVVTVSFAAATISFVIVTIDERKSSNFSIQPTSQGLSLIEAQYPGAARAIQTFERLPDGITLEGQGNAYSMTTHVTTLSGKRAYLGWMNHVDLLIRKSDESKRRADITEKVYTSFQCQSAKNILLRENINYLVVGPLEQARYGSRLLNNYGCLNTVVESGQYKIFSVNPLKETQY